MSASPYLAAEGLSLTKRYCQEEGYPLALIRGRSRSRQVTRARHVVIWRLAKDTDLSLPEIAAILKRDHTSVLHAVRAENERRNTDVRGMQFPAGYHERHRLAALVYAELSREVFA